MGEFPLQDDVLLDTTRKLDDLGISYMLTGGYALSFYTTPRTTIDLDLVLKVGEEDLGVVLRLFPVDEGWYVSEEAARTALRNQGMFNVLLPAAGIKFDMIVLKSEPFERTKFSRRVRLTKRGQSLSIIRAEDLLLSKLVWGKKGDSDKQLNDARTLLRGVKDLDWAYVEQWAKQLDVHDWLERARVGA